MNVVLVHPEHGAKIATHDDEISHDEKLGWKRYNADTPVEVVSEPVVEAPKRKYTRKVTEQPIEQPNSEKLASDESEGS